MDHRRTVDYTNGVISIVSGDDWSEAAIIAHFDELDRMAAQVRQRHGIIRVFADLTHTSIRPASTAELYRQRANSLYQVTDRLAMVTDSQLYRMQLRRTMPKCEAEIFASASEAIAWLMRPYDKVGS
jgi:hypothetical protein